MEKKFCVYKHTNKINGKVYIGITSQRPRKRWDCGRGYIQNKHFWDSIQKYGWDNFEHEILFEKLSPQDAFKKEQELISKYESRDYRKGYNISPGGECGSGLTGEKHPMFGRHHTLEAREKMSNARKGVPYSPERYAEFLKTLDREMLRERAYRTIVGYNKGRHHSDEVKRKIAESNRGQKRSEETKSRIGESKKKSIVQLTRDGTFVREWDSIKTASEQLGLDASHISKVCNHQRKTTGGYRWLFLREWR